MIKTSGVAVFASITLEMKQSKNPTFSFLKRQNQNEQSSRHESAAAVSQVFGCVWFLHLVLIVASSKSRKDVHPPPPTPVPVQGGKKQHSRTGQVDQVDPSDGRPERTSDEEHHTNAKKIQAAWAGGGGAAKKRFFGALDKTQQKTETPAPRPHGRGGGGNLTKLCWHHHVERAVS